jgi:hypothetical protein
LAALVLAGAAAPAAGQITQAEIRGVVRDASEAAIPGATVTATHVETGATRETTSVASGAFRIAAVPVGTYRLRASLTGFKAEVRDGVRLGVGEVAAIDFTLVPGAIEETVEVRAEQALVSTQQSTLMARVTPAQIENLPLNGRDWLGLVALAPGARGNPGDIRSGVSGSDGAKYLMDGADVSNQCCLGTNTGYSLETIEEFRVLSSRFDAEYGRAGGLVIDAVTKSGTNTFRGAAFGFLRHDRFDAENPFTGRVEPFKERQLGFTIGGPLKIDRAHFFASYEHHDRDATAIPNTGFSSYDSSVDQDRQRHLPSLRTDVQFGSAHRLFGRVSTRRQTETNVGVGGRITEHAGRTARNNGLDVSVGDSWVLGDRAVNQLRVYFSHRHQPTEPNNATPRLNFPSIVLGAGLSDAQVLTEKNLGISNTLSYFSSWRGEHSLRMGFEAFRVHFYGATPTVSYGQFDFVVDPLDPTDPRTYPAPTRFQQDLGLFSYDIVNPTFSAFIQDDWRLGSRLTLNLGLRYDVETGAYNDVSNPFAAVEPGSRRADRNNIGPRLGFAYDLSGEGRLVVRGGVGRYYGRLLLDILNIEVTNVDLRKVRASVSNPSMSNPLGGRTEDDFRAGLGAVDYFYVANDLEIESQDQAAIGIAAQIGSRLGLEIDYVRIEGRNVPMQRNVNLFEDQATGLPLNPRTAGRPFPRYAAVFREESTGYSQYDGVQTGFQARRAGGFLDLQGSYTLSRTKDTYTSNRFGFLNNPFDLDDEYADSLADQRHRFIVNGTAHLPWNTVVSTVFFAGSPRPININTRLDPFGVGNYGFGSTRWLDASGARIPRNGERADRWDLKLDLRIAKAIRMGRTSLQGIVDVFNALNRENWNPATYGTTFGTARYLLPGFSSADFYQPRQIQFGFRFTY